jgi:uncharacterized protein (TIGR02265 family)
MDLQRARHLVERHPESNRELRRLFDWISETPHANTVKGMYVTGIGQALNARGVSYVAPARIHPFKDYPLREYMELLLDSAVTLYPDVPVHVGLYRLGQLAIPTFGSSIVGRVIMGTVGQSWELALKCVTRGYEVSLKPGKAVVAELKQGTALLELRDIWNFGDSYQVGVVHGLLTCCGLSGKITPRVISRGDVDLRIEWQKATGVRSSRSQRPLPADLRA